MEAGEGGGQASGKSRSLSTSSVAAAGPPHTLTNHLNHSDKQQYQFFGSFLNKVFKTVPGTGDPELIHRIFSASFPLISCYISSMSPVWWSPQTPGMFDPLVCICSVWIPCTPGRPTLNVTVFGLVVVKMFYV